MLRFHLPLIEPDVRFSRIRLSDQTHAFAHEKRARKRTQPDNAQLPIQIVRREACVPPIPYLVLRAPPLTEPVEDVVIHAPPGLADRAYAEVVRPADQHAVERRPPFPPATSTAMCRLVSSWIRSRSRRSDFCDGRIPRYAPPVRGDHSRPNV